MKNICHFSPPPPRIPRSKKLTQFSNREFWYEEARSALRRRLQQNPPSVGSKTHARNVILFVGDGMSLTTITASRILKGQRGGRSGEEQDLAWDKFPAVALVKTYNADAQVGESSACSTALMCGVKANFETLGLDTRGKFENCLSSFSSKVPSLMDWAQEEGKMTGIVTNTRITHATPAALYAHTPSRYWEDDGKVPPASRKSCKDIARQLIEDDPGKNINVILGGGRRHWLPKVAKDPESDKDEGRRLDGRNLIDDWIRDKKRRGLNSAYVWNKSQMEEINKKQIDHLLGLFSYSHMDFETDRNTGPDGDPSLADMTRTALNMLQKSTKGFFLFVEGGRIDHAHHYNNAYRALDETIALESAVLTAMSMVDLSETLIVLTSDHSHVMTMGGTDGKVSDIDGFPYSTLIYGNGPGFSEPRTIPNNGTTVGKQAEEKNSVHGAAVPRQWATHGGEDVPIYAQGPLASSVFTGVIDQSYIPHAIAYAACWGFHSHRCSNGLDNYTTSQVQTACSSLPDVSSASTGSHGSGQPIVIASSVMSDNGRSNFMGTIYVYFIYYQVFNIFYNNLININIIIIIIIIIINN
ncbi:Alkaline phosphatase, tissue-nonspecific isozyme precursor, putative [Pediculus humanus corporis]|uniref:alkaline phosphatase n=1 Tax=Pediculus humanus subsp. corporis TaxID=121224 RepID=E0VJV3_PEDHC|nr:Alkaline phosphatase, tissue-nonspecific isozyme precursor, putative [Pediculus humanus corporis]EEB13659.1 Alkaline phosphatase, tissue-nonspecific isozyme precursor, putative [Pediculus humanus corporis]